MTLDHRDGSAGLSSLRGAVGATVAFTALSLIGLGVGWAWLFQRTSQSSAVHDAGRYGALSGKAALAPFITDDLLTGSKGAIDRVAIAGGRVTVRSLDCELVVDQVYRGSAIT